MKIRVHRENSGIALLIVMCAIFVLSILAAGLSYSMKVESKLAVGANANPQLVWLGRSGVEFERWYLAQDLVFQPMFQSKQQLWAGGTGGVGETNSVLAGIDLHHIDIGGGWVSIDKVLDLEQYMNINTASGQEIQQALTLMGVDAGDISVISDSIQDWVQPGDAPRIAGAKDDYYQGLNPPYHCREAPMDDLSELLLVRGIRDHPEIYDPKQYGGTTPFHHKLGFGTAPGQTPDYPFGLKDIFTPFSTGRVNINTAGKNVLQVLFMTTGVDIGTAESWADATIQYRAGPDGVEGDEDDTPFQNINQLTAAGINPAAIGAISRLADVRSATFEVTLTAHLATYQRVFHAILFWPGGRNVEVVRFYWNY